MRKPIIVRVDSEQLAQLDLLTRQRDLSREQGIRAAIATYIKRLGRYGTTKGADDVQRDTEQSA